MPKYLFLIIALFSVSVFAFDPVEPLASEGFDSEQIEFIVLDAPEPVSIAPAEFRSTVTGEITQSPPKTACLWLYGKRKPIQRLNPSRTASAQ